MPKPINKIQIAGTLTADPKITLIQKGNKPLKIANFAIAFDWWHKKLSPAWFFNCTAFGYTADACEKFLAKGKRIIITDAYLQQNKYKAKDGSTKLEYKIMVDDFVMLGYNKTQEGQDLESAIEEIGGEEIDEIPC
jgi:single-strand DNA-binding protein